jgi:hypothetical protein
VVITNEFSLSLSLSLREMLYCSAHCEHPFRPGGCAQIWHDTHTHTHTNTAYVLMWQTRWSVWQSPPLKIKLRRLFFVVVIPSKILLAGDRPGERPKISNHINPSHIILCYIILWVSGEMMRWEHFSALGRNSRPLFCCGVCVCVSLLKCIYFTITMPQCLWANIPV